MLEIVLRDPTLRERLSQRTSLLQRSYQYMRQPAPNVFAVHKTINKTLRDRFAIGLARAIADAFFGAVVASALDIRAARPTRTLSD